MRRRRVEPTLTDSFLDTRADYEAAKRGGRFQRRRRGLAPMGAGADWHYRSESDFLYMSEVARDIYRNDPLVGQLTDRAVTNTIGSGFTPDPDTGDQGLDAALKARWLEESVDPDFCDTAGELTFHEQEELALRETLVAGEVFGLPTDDGTVELLECHRCRSPSRTRRNMVHGIELVRNTRRRRNYYFTREPIDPLSSATIKLDDLRAVPARDAEGEANVFHVFSPKRPSQTHGVSAYVPIITTAGMFEDLNFANLLKSQLNAFYLLVRNRTKGYFDSNPVMQKMGLTTEAFVGARHTEAAAPGSEICGDAGEMVTPWNPNSPPAEFFPHARLIMTLIGANIGMPLVLVLMDASETNFSGFRGAVDQARLGFRRNQRILIWRWHRPYWRFKLNYWAFDDPALAAQRERLGAAFYRHKWNPPGWPYIEPTKDAMADLVRAAHMQTSPRRLCAERGGMEWSDIVAETVADRALAIETALEKAQEINQTYRLEGVDAVKWRDLAPLPVPERVTVNLSAADAARETGESDEPRPAKSAA